MGAFDLLALQNLSVLFVIEPAAAEIDFPQGVRSTQML
jgi:hypothetical protein